MNGGRFDFDDGGTYVGGWEEGKAHGHGVCTGPQAKGEYAGAWHYGFEVSGVYTWPSGNTYQGQWQNGKRHGLGVEQRGRWLYKGEWTQGYKGRYGVRQSANSQARYQGTWSAGFHDGYGTEIYVDSGSYEGQWLRGMRHGYGIRKSTTYANAAKFRSKSQTHASLTSLRSGRVEEENAEEQHRHKEGLSGRGGFVLRANSAAPQRRRRSLSERSLAVKRTLLSGLRIKKQHSTGDIHQRVASMTGSLRSSGSTMSCTSEDSLHHHGMQQPEEEAVEESSIETYMGEWKNDMRSGFGVCERSDGLKYHGEWANNAKCGFGVTTFKDGTKEEGRYKNNILIASSRRKGVIFMRASKFREKLEQAMGAAQRAASIAQQKADIAASRTSTAKERSEQATYIARQAAEDSGEARIRAKQFDPSFKQPGTRRLLKDNNGGESFGTDLSDALSYSRHLSQTHSKQHSFEQTLSVDMAEDMTPPSRSYQNHVSNTNHVNFMPQYGYSDPNSQIQTPIISQDLLQPHIPINDPTLPSVSVVQEEEKPLIVQPQTNISQPGPSNLNTQAPNVMSSRFSLSDDHYDQYVMAGGSQQQQQQQQKLRRNRPSLMRQADVNESCAGGGTSGGLNRRSTLASARDRNGDVNHQTGALGAAHAAKLATSSDGENMGSLPNLAELETQGVRMRREEAARLAGQRRQEVLREHEEAALLRANPLRHFLQPSFRAWLVRWRIPILLAIANISLLMLFYHLLTYEKKKKSSS
uniref:Junctophilin n=1 Tax=Caenorhabditis tropicalis TaxID=1561998 RepID=A0A1I7V515_9PELO